jgi:hypothetical protein
LPGNIHSRAGQVKDRTKRLKKLMKDHGLSTADVGEMLSRTPHTVRCWRCQWEARVIPAHTLELLEVKISQRMVHA